MDKKKQMVNVAFGGNWSEAILATDDLRSVVQVIEAAVAECGNTDVEDENLHQAMLYVRKNIEKGPMLCEAFFKGLKIESPILRQRELERIYELILNCAGL